MNVLPSCANDKMSKIKIKKFVAHSVKEQNTRGYLECAPANAHFTFEQAVDSCEPKKHIAGGQ